MNIRERDQERHEKPRPTWRVNAGLRSRGSCVVVTYGEVELWLDPAAAKALGQGILHVATDLLKEDSEIRKLIQGKRKQVETGPGRPEKAGTSHPGAAAASER